MSSPKEKSKQKVWQKKKLWSEFHYQKSNDNFNFFFSLIAFKQRISDHTQNPMCLKNHQKVSFDFWRENIQIIWFWNKHWLLARKIKLVFLFLILLIFGAKIQIFFIRNEHKMRLLWIFQPQCFIRKRTILNPSICQKKSWQMTVSRVPVKPLFALKIGGSTVFENHKKVAFNFASEASYVYILSRQKFIKMPKLVHFGYLENARIQKFKCDIFDDFQTLWP